MERIRKIDNSVTTYLNALLTASGYGHYTFTDSYPTGYCALPCIVTEYVDTSRVRTEIGSKRTTDLSSFLITVMARSDGEMLDTCDIIMRHFDSVQIDVVDIPRSTGTDNLITNPNFDSLDNWNLGTAGTAEMSYECIPIVGECDHYLTCPWASRQLLNPTWFLCNEFVQSGTYSLGLFTEQHTATLKASGDEIALGAGTYLVSGQSWKEINFMDNIKIGVYEGESELATTTGYSLAHSQQNLSRVWTSQTAEFTITEAKNVRIVLSATTQKPVNTSDDLATPCYDNFHCAWDALGLFEITPASSGGEKIFVRDAFAIGMERNMNRFEGNISIEIED